MKECLYWLVQEDKTQGFGKSSLETQTSFITLKNHTPEICSNLIKWLSQGVQFSH